MGTRSGLDKLEIEGLHSQVEVSEVVRRPDLGLGVEGKAVHRDCSLLENLDMRC